MLTQQTLRMPLKHAATIELPTSRRIILRDQNALSRFCN